MTARRWEQNVQALFDRLTQDLFKGTAWDLAKEIGISYDQVNDALWRVRQPEWIEEHHWTIPFVVRGSDLNTWRIVDTQDLADQQVMQDASNLRAHEMHRTTVVNIGQASLAAATADGRTTMGRYWRNVLVSLEATRAHLELILSDGDDGADGAAA